MRVSLINLNLVAHDATGQAILHQLRYFRRRGDEVAIYTMHPPVGVAADVASAVRVKDLLDLLDGQDEHFRTSDLYVYHFPGHYELLQTIKGLERGAVVFFYHNVTPPALWGAQTGLTELAQSQAAVGKLLPYADLVVTVSPFNRDQLVRDEGITPDRVRVLPLAVPLDYFQPGAADPALVQRYRLGGKRVLLYVGRVAGNKRVDLLVDTLAQVRRSLPNTVLLVVGDYASNPAFAEVMAGIRARIAALGLEESVIFTGRVDALPPYYRLADLYVSASLHEGFGVPLIEAMASGVPVVVSHATAHPWVVGDAGVLTPPDAPAAMAAEVVALLQDDTRYGELVQRGLARAQEFSLEAFHAGWGQIVAEVQEWLVARPYRPARPSTANPNATTAGTSATELIYLPQDEEVAVLQKAASQVLQPYQVRSGVPLIGPLIVWLRRNLTSHLREPYLDPTLRRQDRFNRLVVQAMGQLSARLPQGESNPAQDTTPELAQRVARLEALLAALQATLQRQLAEVSALSPGPLREALVVLLHEQMAALGENVESGSEASHGPSDSHHA